MNVYLFLKLSLPLYSHTAMMGVFSLIVLLKQAGLDNTQSISVMMYNQILCITHYASLKRNHNLFVFTHTNKGHSKQLNIHHTHAFMAILVTFYCDNKTWKFSIIKTKGCHWSTLFKSELFQIWNIKYFQMHTMFGLNINVEIIVINHSHLATIDTINLGMQSKIWEPLLSLLHRNG